MVSEQADRITATVTIPMPFGGSIELLAEVTPDKVRILSADGIREYRSIEVPERHDTAATVVMPRVLPMPTNTQRPQALKAVADPVTAYPIGGTGKWLEAVYNPVDGTLVGFVSPERADEVARQIRGLVVLLPIGADYRRPQPAPEQIGWAPGSRHRDPRMAPAGWNAER